ncbi:hypothetical protein HDU98_005711, partial [Podochytrium sp. JEL0797]
ALPSISDIDDRYNRIQERLQTFKNNTSRRLFHAECAPCPAEGEEDLDLEGDERLDLLECLLNVEQAMETYKREHTGRREHAKHEYHRVETNNKWREKARACEGEALNTILEHVDEKLSLDLRSVKRYLDATKILFDRAKNLTEYDASMI